MKDYPFVESIVEAAFRNEAYSDHKEHLLVKKLRSSPAYIPELSIVAEFNNELVGHILLTKIKVIDGEKEYEGLALAPVSVLPKYQTRGIGSKLIEEAHLKARSMNFGFILLIGHEDYYPRFGYKLAKDFDISFPFDVPEESAFVIELNEDGLKEVRGIVKYDNAFLS